MEEQKPASITQGRIVPDFMNRNMWVDPLTHTVGDKLDFASLEDDIYGRTYSSKMWAEGFKPAHAASFIDLDGRSLPLGSWVHGMYRIGGDRYRHGWGVLCAKPSRWPSCMSEDGTRSLAVYFLPEGQHCVQEMHLCNMWEIANERPEKKTDFEKALGFCNRWGLGKGKALEALYGTIPHPVSTIHDETVVELRFPNHPPRFTTNGVFDDRSIGLTNIQPIVGTLFTTTRDDSMAVSVDAEGLPTHWHCPDCDHDNDFNISPRKCGVCRRYKP